MRDYELVVLLHPDLEIDLDKPLGKVEKILTDNGGKVLKTDNWGKRKLAYPIRKEDFAVYVYMDVQLDPKDISKIESALNITEEVLRYLLVHPVPKVTKKEEDKDKEAVEAKAKEEQDNG